VFAATFVWHRFFNLPTPLALKIFGAAVLMSVLILTLAGAALVKIWNEGSYGAVRASMAVFLSLLVLAVPLWSLPKLISLPRLYDISTDLTSPPAYDRVSKIRQAQANPVHYDPAFARLQAAAYPDIKPMLVGRPLADTYTAVRDALKALSWKVIDEQTPEGGRTGYIEAADRTLIFGFTDDIAIRITGSSKASKIDIRSSSRFGAHDLGRNAERIRRFFGEVKSRLAELERSERMSQLVAAREAAEKEDAKRRTRRRRDDDDD
jgi:uncharacterized protein (DUF1499 family)